MHFDYTKDADFGSVFTRFNANYELRSRTSDSPLDPFGDNTVNNGVRVHLSTTLGMTCDNLRGAGHFQL